MQKLETIFLRQRFVLKSSYRFKGGCWRKRRELVVLTASKAAAQPHVLSGTRESMWESLINAPASGISSVGARSDRGYKPRGNHAVWVSELADLFVVLKSPITQQIARANASYPNILIAHTNSSKANINRGQPPSRSFTSISRIQSQILTSKPGAGLYPSSHPPPPRTNTHFIAYQHTLQSATYTSPDPPTPWFRPTHNFTHQHVMILPLWKLPALSHLGSTPAQRLGFYIKHTSYADPNTLKRKQEFKNVLAWGQTAHSHTGRSPLAS